MNFRTDYVALLGRIMLASVLFLAGFGAIGALPGAVEYASGTGFLAAVDPLLRTLTRLVELSGAAAIALGWKTRSASLVVLVVTVAAAFLFQRFWDAAPGEAMLQQMMFMKSVSVIGGLLLLIAFGPGMYALDDAEDRSTDGGYWRKPGTLPAENPGNGD